MGTKLYVGDQLFTGTDTRAAIKFVLGGASASRGATTSAWSASASWK